MNHLAQAPDNNNSVVSNFSKIDNWCWWDPSVVDNCSDPGVSTLLASPLLWRHAAISFSAVARVQLLLTSLLLLVLPLMLVSLLMLASLQCCCVAFCCWHRGAHFPPTTAVVGTGGKFATSVNDISGQWKSPERCDHRCRGASCVANVSANVCKNSKWP